MPAPHAFPRKRCRAPVLEGRSASVPPVRVHHLAADDRVDDLDVGNVVLVHRQDVPIEHGDVAQLADRERPFDVLLEPGEGIVDRV